MASEEIDVVVDNEGVAEGPYRVEAEEDTKECGGCGQLAPHYWIVGPDDVGDSMSFVRAEDAEDRCQAFNIGWQVGRASARKDLEAAHAAAGGLRVALGNVARAEAAYRGACAIMRNALLGIVPIVERILKTAPFAVERQLLETIVDRAREATAAAPSCGELLLGHEFERGNFAHTRDRCGFYLGKGDPIKEFNYCGRVELSHYLTEAERETP